MRTLASAFVSLLLPSIACASIVNIDIRGGPNRFVVVSPVPGQGTNQCTINVGDTVVWTWFSSFHSVTSDAGDFDSGIRNSGATFQVTFSTPGLFGYHCSVHGAPGEGQFGTINVLQPACVGDINTDGVVDLADLAILLAGFGTESGATPGQGDVDGDTDIDLEDLAVVLSRFGQSC